MIFYIGKALQEGSIVFEWKHQRPDGKIWDAEVHLLSFSVDGIKLLEFTIIDITERKLTEKMRWMIHDLVLDLNSCTDLHEGLDKVLKTLVGLECLDCGGVYVADPADNSLSIAAHVGLSAGFIALASHYPGDAPNVRLAASGEVRYGVYADIIRGKELALKQEGLRAFAMIPILCRGKLIALLNLASRKYDEIPEGTRNFLQTIAFQIGGSLLRLRTEAALRENVVLFQSFLDNMPGMAIIKNHEMRPVFVNELFRRHFPDAHVADKGPAALTQNTDTIAFIRKTDQQALTGGPVVFEEEWKEKDGSVRTIEVRKFAIRRGDCPPYLGTTIHDVSDRKRIENKLQNTQKLESLGVLAGGIAHDFNNLLGGIYGMVDCARMEPVREKSNDFLVKAVATLDRARALTRQLLTFAKGGSPVKKKERLTSFLQDTVQFALSGASVSCRFDLQQNLACCEIDRNQIGQVIDNIVINAVQAMPGGGTIEVSARNVRITEKDHPVPNAGDYVRISIKDQGIGIPKEYLSRIFDPFFTTKQTGHGLGLATCFSIMNRHGGCIEVESEPGKGSSFHLFLPACAAPGAHGDGQTASTHSGSGVFLVMDDEEVMRDSIGAMLSSFGYDVALVGDGAEAIKYFSEAVASKRDIAGMLFDLTVPGGIGGKEALTEIRKLCSTTPVFVSSGYAEDPVMASPTLYGFTASICKPFLLANLAELLNAHVNPR
jgi:PAS domain S-box-containing protein